MTKRHWQEIDEALPQTQCGLCGYGGCRPYAEKLIDEEAPINLCDPGGIPVLKKLGELLNKAPEPYLDLVARREKPIEVAVIREDECIGCTKCIAACPVDAIIGAGKLMHTVITDECTGCGLCIPPCPVDCIEMISTDIKYHLPDKSAQFKARFEARNLRLKKEKQKEHAKKLQKTIDAKKSYIEEAMKRVRSLKTPKT